MCIRLATGMSTTFHKFKRSLVGKQCDQIGRFFALWATIQSQWQQLFYPNCPRC